MSALIVGEKKNDPCHPDYVPSVFPQNENSSATSSTKSTVKVDRHKRAMKRALTNGMYNKMCL